MGQNGADTKHEMAEVNGPAGGQNTNGNEPSSYGGNSEKANAVLNPPRYFSE